MPCRAVSVLHQLLGDPRHVIEPNDEIGPKRPKARSSKTLERSACFAHAHHPSRSVGAQHPPALSASTRANFSEIPFDLAHA
jgi:hypothetical protein